MSTAEERTVDRATAARRWRFLMVLAAALLVSAGQPLLSERVGDQRLFDASVGLLIAAVLLIVVQPGSPRRAAQIVAIGAIVSLCAANLVPGRNDSVFAVIAHLLTALLFALVLWDIVREILAGHSTGDAILAALCGYLLLGIVWSLLYETVNTAVPGSFRVATSAGSDDAAAVADRSDLGYYSFITLATVGYGDIVPVTRLARTLAWIEAVTGQFYIAVLVAGLVGLKVTESRSPRHSNQA
ncbi:MAG TPA: potassium channel family protein [Lacipirellulaceae bacterium]|nr:potassium channel family protein [Lacipirellulaceae bacterium]